MIQSEKTTKEEDLKESHEILVTVEMQEDEDGTWKYLEIVLKIIKHEGQNELNCTKKKEKRNEK